MGAGAAAVMAGAGPPSTPLFAHAKGVDADLRRHDEAAGRMVNVIAEW